MKNTYCWLVLIVLAMPCREAPGVATNRYVATNGTAIWPYTNWVGAATNIKDAVDVANANNAGDIVYVSNGTYLVSVQIDVTNCVVTNVNADPALVVVAGTYPASTNRIFYLNHSNAAVSGLTITNGRDSTLGGGVYINNGSIYRCLVTGNSVTNAGTDYGGGGIHIKYGIIADCTIADNTINSAVANYVGGGGVFMQQFGIATVRGCLIERNVAAGTASGGGIMAYYGSGVQTGIVENCSIISNQARSASYGGGGIYCYAGGSLLLIRNCIIMGNSATNDTTGVSGVGGGINMTYGGATVRNCLIVNNACHVYGGGINTGGSQVNGCTIISNSSVHGGGGGLCAGGGAKSNVSNCIVYYNAGLNLYAIGGGVDYTSVTYSCTSAGSGFTITGVVTAPPQFMGASSNYFWLARSSPCINAGLNQAWMEGALDLAGHARIDPFARRVDMGAYEFLPQGAILRVR